MNFADKLKTIDLEKIEQEKKKLANEELVTKREAEKRYIYYMVEQYFTKAKESGYFNGNIIQGFWCYLPRWGGEEELTLVLCSPEDIYPSIPTKDVKRGKHYIGITPRWLANMEYVMSNILSHMDYFQNQKYCSDVFLDMLKDVLIELGFKNVVCQRMQSYYYREETGLIWYHWKKIPVDVGFMSCSF